MALVANDFTVMGAGSSRINGRKMRHTKGVAKSCGLPIVFFGESTGARMPDVMGAGNIGGAEGERKGVIGKVMNWMNAISLVTMPKIAIVMGKSYGQAVLNMGGASNAHEVAAWTTAEIGFMAPDYAVKIVYGTDAEKDPEKYAAERAEMARSTSPFDAAANFSIQSVIDPREIRDYLIRSLEFHRLRLSGGIGQHLMRTWPTSY